MKVAIIGLGFRMASVARCFLAADPDFTITGYYDPSPSGLPELTALGIDTGIARDSVEALIGAGGFDVLMVGSPNHLHLEHIRAGLAHGVRVFSEKPVVTTETDSLELASLLRQYGEESVMVGLVLRYAPLYVDLRRAQAAGMLGEIVSIEACEHIATYHGAFFMRDWRRYQKYSGNYMLEKCCHDLDLYQGLVGCRPMHVASFGGRRSFIPENAPARRGVNDLDVYHRKPVGWEETHNVFDSDADIIDYQTAILEYQNGVSMAFHCNLNVPDEFRRFCVIGNRGQAEGDFVRNYFRVTDSHSARRLIDTSYQPAEIGSHYGADEQMARDIVRHLKGELTLPVGVIDALEAGLTAIKIEEARVTRSMVDLTDTWARFDAALGR
jgi:predicted dehydrogenase